MLENEGMTLPEEEGEFYIVKPMRTKEELIREISKYVDPETGRKRRSDRGKGRHIYNTSSYQTKMHVYKKVRGRIVNRDKRLKAEDGSSTSLLSLEFDENGFYLPIPESYKTISAYYKQDWHGRAIEHTVRRVRTQKAVDLERYRFEAWQEMATEHPDEIVPANDDLRGMLFHRYGFTTEQSNQAIENRQICWLTLFCEMYFIRLEDAGKWDYATWKEYYNCCPTQAFPDDFEFIYGVKPGTEYFHPEWAYIATRREEEAKREAEIEAKRKSEQFIGNMKGGK